MLQSVPEDIPVDELTRKLTEIEGIRSIHDMHLWSLDGESHVMTLHAVTSGTNFHQLKEEIQAVANLKNREKNAFATLLSRNKINPTEASVSGRANPFTT